MFTVGVKTSVYKPKKLNNMYLLVHFFFLLSRTHGVYLCFMNTDKVTFKAACSLKKMYLWTSPS